MSTQPLVQFELSEAHFSRVKKLLYDVCGIDLRPGKEGLVKARLGKRLRSLGLATFDAYLDLLEAEDGSQELPLLVDSMTTNKTSFFRESRHFDFLAEEVLPRWQARPGLRFWSAACSSGEEPFTMAMVLRENLPDIDGADVRILATDISSRVLAAARRGEYTEERLADVPPVLRQRYFESEGRGEHRTYRIAPSIQRLVRFARLNLMEAWPMRGPFDAIFCRNVMIYFDKPTQARLINRFYDLIAPGGYLFIGHSESLTGITHPFRYVQPALYAR